MCGSSASTHFQCDLKVFRLFTQGAKLALSPSFSKMHRSVLLSLLVLLAAPVAALLPGAGRSLSATRPAVVSVRMGPAEDGPFTPLCLVGKVALGQTTFNKYRGKVISIHSG